jgi:tetratricopeptide (TPR) repeat protein
MMMRTVLGCAAALATSIAFGSALAVAQEKPKAPSLPLIPTSSPASMATATTPGAPAAAASAPVATASTPSPPPPGSEKAPDKSAEPTTHGEGMRAYHNALLQRRLGWQEITRDELHDRLAECEGLLQDGRTDEAVSRLTEVVEHPRFDVFAESEDGRAAVWLLADALSTAGAYEPARAYLRRLLKMSGAWDGSAPYARRAVRRLVEIAMEDDEFATALDDLKDVPTTAPEETRGEVAYIAGRAREAAGDPDGAVAQYAIVTPRSRFWAQATYLMGLIDVEKGRFKEGEQLFCKVADPGRQSATTPVFADERYFAVRDLARLGLGRVAHEQARFDDARYYYYLVPRDSDRLAEALYEAATSRYEKKDYQGARELLDELKTIQTHHRYEDEAWILDAYIDLAQCKFDDADKKLRGFLVRYEPVRDYARRVAEDERSVATLVAAARTGSDAGGAVIGGASAADSMRAIAALVRIDPAYRSVARRRSILEHEASGLKLSMGWIDDMQRKLATNGGVRPAVEEHEDRAEQAADASAALDGLRHQIDDLEASHAPADKVAPLKQELASLEGRRSQAAGGEGPGVQGGAGGAGDLADLLHNDAVQAGTLSANVELARQQVDKTEVGLAKDALRRVDLRLSRLLRRARLGRVESVLGRKRALEVEIEAINDGVLPASALDLPDAARYLKDTEEYWPFEGDDWPDEFIGSETAK